MGAGFLPQSLFIPPKFLSFAILSCPSHSVTSPLKMPKTQMSVLSKQGSIHLREKVFPLLCARWMLLENGISPPTCGVFLLFFLQKAYQRADRVLLAHKHSLWWQRKSRGASGPKEPSNHPVLPQSTVCVEAIFRTFVLACCCGGVLLPAGTASPYLCPNITCMVTSLLNDQYSHINH